jgi:hypothetical protein
MDTKKLLIFIAGAAVAVFVMKQIEKNKKVVAPTPTPTPADPKLTACQAQLAEELKVVRTTDIEGFSTQFISECMAAASEVTGNIPVLPESGPIPGNVMVNEELGIQV